MNSAPVFKAALADEEETLALGAALAPCLAPGLTIYLRGELGAGKTTLVRGMLRALGHAGPVRSPTYALVEVYDLSRLHLHHFDFYRFHDPREWIDAGFRESFDGRNITVIEWPEKAGSWLPPADVEITFDFAKEGREVILESGSLVGQRCLALLERSAAAPRASSSS
jgi:tRNA threonylcarbamoyladenosine biosynthesis protein TsaE